MDKQKLIVLVKEYIAIEDKLAAMRKEMKGLQTEKKELGLQLMAVMKEHDTFTIDVKQTKIMRQTRTTKTPLSKKYLSACLLKFFKDEEAAKDLLKFIIESRTSNVNDVLVKK
jgi:hypothetical protein